MVKKNDILSAGFLDFQIFAHPEPKNEEFTLDQSQQFSTLVVYQVESDSEALEKFLSNILTAAKLDMSKDVLLYKSTVKNEFSFIRTKTKSNIEQVIIFGIHPKKLGINLDMKLYTPIDFQDCTFLLANSLSDIKNDQTKKKLLWTCLQEIYLK